MSTNRSHKYGLSIDTMWNDLKPQVHQVIKKYFAEHNLSIEKLKKCRISENYERRAYQAPVSPYNVPNKDDDKNLLDNSVVPPIVLILYKKDDRLEIETTRYTRPFLTMETDYLLATAAYLRYRINSLIHHVLFDYKGIPCGVDPFSHKEFDVWYGDKAETMTSIDEVMNKPFFDGKSLTEIVPEIENLEL